MRLRLRDGLDVAACFADSFPEVVDLPGDDIDGTLLPVVVPPGAGVFDTGANERCRGFYDGVGECYERADHGPSTRWYQS